VRERRGEEGKNIFFHSMSKLPLIELTLIEAQSGDTEACPILDATVAYPFYYKIQENEPENQGIMRNNNQQRALNKP